MLSKHSGVFRCSSWIYLFILGDGSISGSGVGEQRLRMLSVPSLLLCGTPASAPIPVRPCWGGTWGSVLFGGGKGLCCLRLPDGPGEGTLKVSGSSPPIGQFSKSAFKFPFVSRRGGQEELFLFKFFSLYVDTKRKFSTGHVRM